MFIEASIIKTEQQYRAYMNEVHDLLSRAPFPNSSESNRLELLTVLIQNYENSKFPVETPDPIDAITFRMQERGLKQTDLVPYLGTRARVSEILGRKRPLTLPMIRALSLGLGISADTLIGVGKGVEEQEHGVVWSDFPIGEMEARGWISRRQSATTPEELVRNYIAHAGLQFGSAEFKRTLVGEAQSPSTRFALYAWLARVVQVARTRASKLGTYSESLISSAFLKELARLSWFEKGPQLAIEMLERNGIAVVVEPQLKGTHVDGAALRDIDSRPIIALSLRYDRLDNFWFTLVHEVVHIWKHAGMQEAFVDDLNVGSNDKREAEANRIAAEAFIPRMIWKRSDAFLSPSRESIDRLSRDMKIHPAIVVGRLRKESNDYSLFSDMVGQNQVKAMLSHLEAEV